MIHTSHWGSVDDSIPWVNERGFQVSLQRCFREKAIHGLSCVCFPDAFLVAMMCHTMQGAACDMQVVNGFCKSIPDPRITRSNSVLNNVR